MKPTGRDNSQTLLQSARRKLAGLFGACNVYDLPIQSIRPARKSHGTDVSPRSFCVAQGSVSAILSADQLPNSQSRDRISFVVSTGADVLPRPAAIAVTSGLPGAPIGRSERLVLSDNAAPHVNRISLMSGDVASARKLDFSKIGVPPVLHADVARPRLLGKADRRAIALGIKTPKVRPVPSRIIADVAIERRREPMPITLGSRSATGFEREMELLRVASGEPTADIKLVGVYCSVPIAAASRLEFDPSTGSLMLNIRENAAQAIGDAKRPAVTLILGQITATGKMIRAFRP